jgi:hypothetical protein
MTEKSPSALVGEIESDMDKDMGPIMKRFLTVIIQKLDKRYKNE